MGRCLPLGAYESPVFHLTYLSFSRNAYVPGEDLTPAASQLSLLNNLLFNLSGITEVDAVGEADVVSTGRIESVRHPLVTEITLAGFSDFFIKSDGVIRTGLDIEKK